VDPNPILKYILQIKPNHSPCPYPYKPWLQQHPLTTYQRLHKHSQARPLSLHHTSPILTIAASDPNPNLNPNFNPRSKTLTIPVGSKSSARRLLHLFTISRHLHTCPPPPVPPLSEFLGESQDCGVEGISEGLQEKINKYAGVVAQGIRRMKPYGVAEMKLCDFIDDLLNFAVHFKRDAILDTCEVNSVDEECEKVGKKEVNQEKGALVDAQIPELVCWALQSCM